MYVCMYIYIRKIRIYPEARYIYISTYIYVSGRSPQGGYGNPLWILAWIISWTEEPGGLQSVWLQRVSLAQSIVVAAQCTVT